MIKTIRKNRLATAPVYFSDKEHTRTIVHGGKGGGRTTKTTKSDEFKTPPPSINVEGTLIGDDQPELKGAAILMLECGFHESVHPAIRASVFNEPPFNKETHVMAFRKSTSTSLLDAALVYRRISTTTFDIYEVLFLAVHPTLKRTGLGRCAVDHLKETLKASPSIKSKKCICVSLKSESSEAAKFWESAGLLKLTDAHAHHTDITGKMVGFADFLPYALFVV